MTVSVGLAQYRGITFSATGNFTHIRNNPPPVATVNMNAAPGYVVVTNNLSISENFKGKLGGSMNALIDYQLGKKVLVSTGLGLNMYRFKKTVVTSSVLSLSGSATGFGNLPPGTLANYGVIYGSFAPDTTGARPLPTDPSVYPMDQNEVSDKIGDSYTLYLEVPLLIGLSFINERLTIRTGVIFSTLALGAVYRSTDSFSAQYGLRSEQSWDTSSDGFTNVLLNGVALFSLKVFKGYSAQIGYRYSFSSVYDKEYQLYRKLHYNNFTIGMAYQFSRSK